MYIPNFCQVNPQIQSLHKHKTHMHKHQTQMFEESVPSLFSYIYQTFVKSIHKTNHFTNIKHTCTNITQMFEESVPSVLVLLKEHIKI